MSTWNPSYILSRPDFRLSESEKAKIISRMPPPSSADGQIYVDAVFEGGGVKGLAFLGALRCFADLGFCWRKVAGTSAGAITAALVSAKFPIDELEAVISNMNYMNFLTEKTSPLILNGNPANDLKSPIRMVLFLLLARQLGQYSSEPFRVWLDENLNKKGFKTFADIKENGQQDLKVVISDVSRGEMLVLPDDLALPDRKEPQERSLQEQLQLSHSDQFSVAEAVRLSMSIPLFFKPGMLGDRKIVDGGILSNFPLWIYDLPQNPSSQRCPRWPTFGLRLAESDNQKDRPINGPFALLGAMFDTMMVARDRYHLSQSNQDRVINLDITDINVTATEFNLSDKKKEHLYCAGYQQTKEFLLEKWDWEQHLRRRGYDPAQLTP